MLSKIIRFYVCFSFLIFAITANSQGFLEMPDTSEVPDFEKESMLLDLDVPPVRDRDPDPEAGPRLNVKEFKLQGLVEYPELGITREALIKRVESIRFDLMKEGELTDSGYTLDELGEVSDLVAEIEKDTEERHVGTLEVQKLVFLIRDQRRRRGVTLGMIETVADTITRFYRERGFILAKAYIPQQKVRDGIVTLTLLLGELGEVAVTNRKRVSNKLISSVFKDNMNKPVTSWQIEESLYLVNDIPGVSAQGFFSPGSQVGDTKLTTNITNESWYNGTFRLDNHGSESTSENRAYLDFYLNNPLGIGDQLYLAVLNSHSPNSSTYNSIRYSSMIGNPRWRGELGYSTNDFLSREIQTTSTVTFSGESEVADSKLSYIFKRSRVKNYSMYLSYLDVSTEIDTSAITKQATKNLTVGFNFDLISEKRRQLYVGSTSLTYADTTRDSDSSTGKISLTPVIWNFDFTALSFFNFPFTQKETRLVARTFGQYAGKTVSNLNQMNLTGPNGARGFGVNGFQADDAIFLGVDWIFSLPKSKAKLFGESWHKVVQPYLFFDAAYGRLKPFEGVLGTSDKSESGLLADVGMGVKFNHSNFSANIFGATVLKDKVVGEEDKTPTTSVYFELQLSF